MGMALEFFVELRKIRSGLAAFVNATRRSPEQSRFQLAIIPAFRQGPGDSRLLCAFQILINRSLADRATAGDLPLSQPQLVSESQYFFELSHGQPLCRQCGPSTSSGASLPTLLSSVLRPVEISPK